MELLRRRHLILNCPAACGNRHLSAASGLIVDGGRMFVIGDDETSLGVFPTEGDTPGKLVDLLPEDLPRDPALRKASKPDFESLFRIPSAETGQLQLCALGSGSTHRRRRAAVITIDHRGDVARIDVLDMAALFAALDKAVAEVNIEGAIVRGDELLLFNRGNNLRPQNTIITVNLAQALSGGNVDILASSPIDLPTMSGVSLCVTDACAMNDGSILISAVAEDTDDSYRDGAVIGAAICVLTSDLRLDRIEKLSSPIKIEGIQGWREDRSIHVIAVSDPDDPAQPGGLFDCTMPA